MTQAIPAQAEACATAEGNSSLQELSSGARAEDFLDAGDVGGDVHGDAAIFTFADADSIAVFEPAQLFELLEMLEFARGERGKFEKRLTAEGVNSNVLEMARGDGLSGVTDPRNWRAGEIEGVGVEIGDDFYGVEVHDFGGLRNGDAKRDDLDFRIGRNRFDGSVNDFRGDERLIALDVDVDFRREVNGDFGDAFGAGTMVAACHGSFAAEGRDRGANAIVVGGDDDARDAAGLPGAFDNVLDHRFTSDRGERLPRKARRLVARGNYGNDI